MRFPTPAALLLAFTGACTDPAPSLIGEADTAGGCFVSGCFDDDPCTDDQCLPSGQCIFVRMDAANACLTDLHCDLGNPCVTGRCVENKCGDLRCSFEEAPGCRPCGGNFGECFDGNVCTPDVCDVETGRCQQEGAPQGCDARCPVGGATPIFEAQWFGTGFTGGFIGRLEVSTTSCDSGCECDAPAVLMGDAGASLSLFRSETLERWTCRLSTCGGTMAVDCGELALSREYVAWGFTMSMNTGGKDAAAPFPGDAGAPPQPADSLAAEVLCPSTRLLDRALIGPWSATLERAGGIAHFDLMVDAAGGSVRFIGIECDGCDAVGLDARELTLDVTVGDPVSAIFRTSAGGAQGSLYAGPFMLSGDLFGADGVTFGRLSLEPVP